MKSILFESKIKDTFDARKLPLQNIYFGFDYQGIMYTNSFNSSLNHVDDPNCNKGLFIYDPRCRYWYMDTLQVPSVIFNTPSLSFGDTEPFMSQMSCQKMMYQNQTQQSTSLSHVLCLETKLTSIQNYFQNFQSSTKQLYIISPQTQTVIFDSNQNDKSDEGSQNDGNSTMKTLQQVEFDNLNPLNSNASQFQQVLNDDFNEWIYKSYDSISQDTISTLSNLSKIVSYQRNGTQYQVILDPIFIFDRVPSYSDSGEKGKILAEVAYMQINIVSDSQLRSQQQQLIAFSNRYFLISVIILLTFGFFSFFVSFYYAVQIKNLVHEPVCHLTEILHKIQVECKNQELSSIFSSYQLNAKEIFLSQETIELYESFQTVFNMLLYTSDNIFKEDSTTTLIRLCAKVDFLRQFHNYKAVGITYNNMGVILLSQNQYFQALENFSNSIVYAKYEIQKFCEENPLAASIYKLKEYSFDYQRPGERNQQAIEGGGEEVDELSKVINLNDVNKDSPPVKNFPIQLNLNYKEDNSYSNKQSEYQIDQIPKAIKVENLKIINNMLPRIPSSINEKVINPSNVQPNYSNRRVNQTSEYHSDFVECGEDMQIQNFKNKLKQINGSREYLEKTQQENGSKNNLRKKSNLSQKRPSVAEQGCSEETSEQVNQLLMNLFYRKYNYIITLIAFQENLIENSPIDKVFSEQPQCYNFWKEIKSLLLELNQITLQLPYHNHLKVVYLCFSSKCYFRTGKFSKAEKVLAEVQKHMENLVQEQHQMSKNISFSKSVNTIKSNTKLRSTTYDKQQNNFLNGIYTSVLKNQYLQSTTNSNNLINQNTINFVSQKQVEIQDQNKLSTNSQTTQKLQQNLIDHFINSQNQQQNDRISSRFSSPQNQINLNQSNIILQQYQQNNKLSNHQQVNSINTSFTVQMYQDKNSLLIDKPNRHSHHQQQTNSHQHNHHNIHNHSHNNTHHHHHHHQHSPHLRSIRHQQSQNNNNNIIALSQTNSPNHSNNNSIVALQTQGVLQINNSTQQLSSFLKFQKSNKYIFQDSNTILSAQNIDGTKSANKLIQSEDNLSLNSFQQNLRPPRNKNFETNLSHQQQENKSFSSHSHLQIKFKQTSSPERNNTKVHEELLVINKKIDKTIQRITHKVVEDDVEEYDIEKNLEKYFEGISEQEKKRQKQDNSYMSRYNDILLSTIHFTEAELNMEEKQFIMAAEKLTLILEKNQRVISHYPYKIINCLRRIFEYYSILSPELNQLLKKFKENQPIKIAMVVDCNSNDKTTFQFLKMTSNIVNQVLTKQYDQIGIVLNNHQENYIQVYMQFTKIVQIKYLLNPILTDLKSILSNVSSSQAIQIMQQIVEETNKSLQNLEQGEKSNLSQKLGDVNDENELSQPNYLSNTNDNSNSRNKLRNHCQQGDLQNSSSSPQQHQSFTPNNLQEKSSNLNLTFSEQFRNNIELESPSPKMLLSKNEKQLPKYLIKDQILKDVEIHKLNDHLGDITDHTQIQNIEMNSSSSKSLSSSKPNQQDENEQPSSVDSEKLIRNDRKSNSLSQSSSSSQSVSSQKLKNEKQEIQNGSFESSDEIKNRNKQFHFLMRKTINQLFNDQLAFGDVKFNNFYESQKKISDNLFNKQQQDDNYIYDMYHLFEQKSYLLCNANKMIVYCVDRVGIIQNDLFNKLCIILFKLDVQLVIFASTKGNNFLEANSDNSYSFQQKVIIRVFYSTNKLVNYLQSKRNQFSKIVYNTYLQHF